MSKNKTRVEPNQIGSTLVLFLEIGSFSIQKVF